MMTPVSIHKRCMLASANAGVCLCRCVALQTCRTSCLRWCRAQIRWPRGPGRLAATTCLPSTSTLSQSSDTLRVGAALIAMLCTSAARTFWRVVLIDSVHEGHACVAAMLLSIAVGIMIVFWGTMIRGTIVAPAGDAMQCTAMTQQDSRRFLTCLWQL